MSAIYALTILLVIFALSEIVAQKTKALLSTTLVIAIVLLIAFWCGLPNDIFKTSGVVGIGMNLVGILILSMGTMMDFPELARQWKTVIIGFVGVMAGVGMIMLIGAILLDRHTAFAGAPIFAGANVATLIMLDAVSVKNLNHLSTFIILMLVTQNFIGIPISSILLRKEATRFLQDKKAVLFYSTSGQSEGAGAFAKRRPLALPKQYNKPSFIMAKLALLACLSFYIAKLSNDNIHYFVVALLMGVVFAELGFLEKNILAKTESSGFIIFATTIIIFGKLSETTPTMLLDSIVPLLFCLALGVFGVVIAGLIISKLLKISPYLAITLGLTCTYGFPTTMLMSKEVAAAIGKTPEEQEAITNYLLPKMITAGFVTVTIASVVIAGIVQSIL